jgi:hypothetical protein
MCNGFNMALLYIGHMSPLWSYIWLPAVIYFLNRALSSDAPYLSASIAGFLWGIQILAGAPQDAFYTFIASMFFLLFHIRNRGRMARTRKLAAIAVLFFAFGAGISAMQVIPAFEFINQSVRAGLDSYDMVTMGSYPPQGIITTLIPHFFGSYADGTYWVKNVPWSIPQQSLYVGILPLILIACIAYRGSENKRVILFAWVLAASALILAFGRHTPIYELAYRLPGFDRFRAPSKIIVLWVFGIAILAARGMDDLLHNRRSLTRGFTFSLILSLLLSMLALMFHFHRSLVLTFFSPFFLPESDPDRFNLAAHLIYTGYQRLVLIVLCVLFAFYLLRKGTYACRLGIACLCLLLLVDLGSATYKSVRHDETFFRSVQEIQKGLEATIGQDRTIYRVGSYKNELGTNLEMYLGYQTVGGFTALFPTRYYEYVNEYTGRQLPVGWESFSYGQADPHSLMDLLNVKYGISHTQKFCHLRETFLPRAFIVPSYKVMKKEEILSYLMRPDFDATRLVLLEEDPNPAPASSSRASRNESGDVHITSYRPDRIVLISNCAEPGFLFLSESFYPGWRAQVDGIEKRILRGNYLFRVIEIPEGTHEVHFVFDPMSIKAGILITLIFCFFLGVFACHHFRRKFFSSNG